MNSSTLHRFSFICVAASFCNLCYELVLAKFLSQFSDDVVTWESLTLAVYLLAMGVGHLYFATKVIDNHAIVLAQTEKKLIIFNLILVPGLLLGHMLYFIYCKEHGFDLGLSWWQRPLNHFLIVSQGGAFFLGILSSLEQHCLLQLNHQHFHLSLSRFYFYNYLGSFLASLGFFGAYLCRLDALGYGLLVIAINIFLLVFIAKLFSNVRFGQMGLVAIILLALIWPFRERWMQIYLKNQYFNILSWNFDDEGMHFTGPLGFWSWLAAEKNYPSIHREYSAYQTIDLVAKKQGKAFSLYLDGHLQFDSLFEASYHEAMIGLMGDVGENILIIGGGDGLLLYRLRQKWPKSRITLVELDPAIINLAKNEPLVALNHGALLDPNVRLIVKDVLLWVKDSKEIFDAIFVDVPHPFGQDCSRLVSYEFFLVLRALIGQGGIIVMDVPKSLYNDESKEILLASLAQARLGLDKTDATYGDGFIRVLPLVTTYAFAPIKVHSLFKPRFAPLFDSRF
mgnify:CR=1 FL=1